MSRRKMVCIKPDTRNTLTKVGLFFVVAVLACIFLFSNQSNARVVFIADKNTLHGGDFTDSPFLADKLNAVFDGDIDLFNGNTEVYYPIGSVMVNSQMYSVRSKVNALSVLYGYQCYIYANAVYNYLFDEFVGHGKGLAHSVAVLSNAGKTASYQLFKDAGVMCGAYLRTTENQDGSYNGSKGHSLIILSYNENEITYIEGNGEGKGYVRGAILSWADFNARQLSGRNRIICHVVQPTQAYYEQKYSDPGLKVSFSLGDTDSAGPSPQYTRYRGVLTLPDNGEENIGWFAKREDTGLWACVGNTWATDDQVRRNLVQRRLFFRSENIAFNAYWYYDSGGHTLRTSEFTFVAAREEDPIPITQQGPFTITYNTSLAGDFKTYETTLNVSKNPGVAFLELDISAPEGYEIKEVENGAVLGAFCDVRNYTWTMSADSFFTGDLLTIRFEKVDSQAGTPDININIIDCFGEIGRVEYILERAS